jgi:ribosomal protein S12 methylthiotransferase
MEAQMEISYDLNQNKIGKTYRVLIDRIEGDYFIGRTEFDSPEVDNEVVIPGSAGLKIGQFVNIKIESAEHFDLFGTPVE